MTPSAFHIQPSVLEPRRIFVRRRQRTRERTFTQLLFIAAILVTLLRLLLLA